MMMETVERDNKKKRVELRNMQTTNDDDKQLPCLPNEEILENILTRLPVIFGFLCKLWYNSIHHDPRFASSHFLHSQNNPHLMFSILNAKDNSHENLRFKNYFFYLSESYDEEGDIKVKVGRFLKRKISMKEELVGYCNGLICRLRLPMSRCPAFHIYHPSRREKLFIIHPIIERDILCYGFGFDTLSNEYKVVFIFFEYNEFKCKVYTLGTNSWREITCHPSTNQVLKKKRSIWTNSEYAAIFCDGVLFWRTTRQPNRNLLSFHLHAETFQVIQLPTQCVSMPPPPTKLMELNGSLCAALLEKILPTDENNNISCKVHLHILKDRSQSSMDQGDTSFLGPFVSLFVRHYYYSYNELL